MTKEELKEAIAATITENGNKGITGQALANLLNEIVDAAGEGGAGGLTLTVGLSLETNQVFSGPNEANAQVYKTIVEGFAKKETYPLNILLDASELGMSVVFTADYYGLMDIFGVYCMMLETLVPGCSSLEVSEDGSITVAQA